MLNIDHSYIHWKNLSKEFNDLHAALQVETQIKPVTPTPRLDIPASREECIVAADEIIANADRQVSEQNRAQVKEKAYQSMVRVLKSLREAVREFDSGWKHVEDVYQATTALQDCLRILRSFQAKVDKSHVVDTQTRLQQLVEGQDEDLTEWFFGEKYNFAKHMTLTLDPPERERVILEDKKCSDDDIPFEIMSMIYSQADLESCVNLRQVSSSWFEAFFEIESILASKVKARNPWFKPGDADVATWADCALVFVARLDTWTEVESLDDFDVSQAIVRTNTHTVVAVELKEDEKLPRDFIGMVDHEAGNCTKYSCEFYHSLDNISILDQMNMWTLEQVKHDFGNFEVMHHTQEETLLIYNGQDITIPMGMSIGVEITAKMGPSTVMFTQFSWLAITSREMREVPLVLPEIRSTPPLEVHLDDTIIVRSKDYLASVALLVACTFKMLSWETEEMVTYAQSDTHNHVPVALYQGLVWWNELGHSLIPTFVDLDRPGFVYYKPEKVIATGHTKGTNFVQGSRSRYSQQFVQTTSASANFFDLETGTVTSVVSPQGCSFGRVFGGFVFGNFVPRCVSRELAQKYGDLMAEREWEFGEEDDYE